MAKQDRIAKVAYIEDGMCLLRNYQWGEVVRDDGEVMYKWRADKDSFPELK